MAEKKETTLSKMSELQDSIYKACSELHENARFIGEELHTQMLCDYKTQYLRETALIDSSELDVDKEILQLKINREKELAEIEAQRAKQAHELEELKAQRRREFELEKAKAEKEFEIQKTKELGEMQLEHDRAIADIARRRQELEFDVQVSEKTLEQELSAKMENITPGFKRRRRFFGIPIGKVKYNQAMELTLEAAELSAYEYLSSHAEEVLKRKAMYCEKMGLSQEELKGVLKFELEVSTEGDKQYYLKAIERENYLESKEQRKAEKAELKRLKKEAKKAKKSNNTEAAESGEVPEQTETGEQMPENEENEGG